MFIIHNDSEIVCITDVKPDGPYVEIQGSDYEYVMTHYEVVGGVLRKKKDYKDWKNLRVAMIASYGMNCGLATYTEYLCNEMVNLVGELKVFTEESSKFNSENIIRCWNRSGEDYDDLLREIREYSPDVVYVQHEYGAFNNGAQWNSLIGHLNAQFKTIVVLHSVYDHFDKLIFEGPCSEVIVHSESSIEALMDKSVDHCKKHVIPHGCIPMKPPADMRFSQMKSKSVLFQYGFGFEYKGWDQAIDIVDSLKDRFPDLVYIGVFNVSQFSKEFNEQYYKRLMKKVRDRGLEKHFVLHKGFRSEEILLSYMRQSAVNIFPYWNHHEWRVHGASGAIRLALASGTPTVVGKVPFFSEFEGHIPVCDTVEDYVDTVSEILKNSSYRNSVINSTAKFIEERTWDKVAVKYLCIL